MGKVLCFALENHFFYENFRNCHLLTLEECIFMVEDHFPEVVPCGT